ncbi:hypothetical protein [Aurantimonas sp. 22II-16-19i]|uniref:hypothetical protein n=1 Tax=Aurantimonas sp. 22II-16-19i TaxID=1317114 RepID=UPI0009F7C35C|nr:hypothetical protein [Aurantimonas sp. 22II-16-19i]ORE90749.1 hypothetical protein ATO4_20786 [Aurantimonas sp. 22II-16-19i]
MLRGTGRQGRIEPEQCPGLVVGMVERVVPVLVIAVPHRIRQGFVVVRMTVIIERGMLREDRVVRGRRTLRRREHGESDCQGDHQMSEKGSAELRHAVGGWFPRADAAILIPDPGAKLVGVEDGAVMVAKGITFASERTNAAAT